MELLASKVFPFRAWEAGKHVHTDNIAAEEGIDPAHDQSIGDDHGHLVLHHAHHAFHRARIAHGIGRSLAATLGILQIRAGFIGSRQGVSAVVERALREHVEVGSNVDAMDERPLLAHGPLILLLGGRGHEDCRVVTQHAGQDLSRGLVQGLVAALQSSCWPYHDDRDGKENPVALSANVSTSCDRRMGDAIVHTIAGDPCRSSAPVLAPC